MCIEPCDESMLLTPVLGQTVMQKKRPVTGKYPLGPRERGGTLKTLRQTTILLWFSDDKKKSSANSYSLKRKKNTNNITKLFFSGQKWISFFWPPRALFWVDVFLYWFVMLLATGILSGYIQPSVWNKIILCWVSSLIVVMFQVKFAEIASKR